MNLILRLILTVSSVSFFLVVYLVQNEVIPCYFDLGQFKWFWYIIYISLPFIFGKISLIICNKLSNSSLQKIISVETSNNDFLANYLAFFFVALSIKGLLSFIVVFVITVVFTFFSRVSYFNPVFLVFGYNFYYVITDENVKIMLISKKKLRNPQSFEKTMVKRINDYTYFEG